MLCLHFVTSQSIFLSVNYRTHTQQNQLSWWVTSAAAIREQGGGSGGVNPPLMGKIRDPPSEVWKRPHPPRTKTTPQALFRQFPWNDSFFPKNFACGSNFAHFQFYFFSKVKYTNFFLPVAAYSNISTILLHSEDYIENISFPAAEDFLNWQSP